MFYCVSCENFSAPSPASLFYFFTFCWFRSSCTVQYLKIAFRQQVRRRGRLERQIYRAFADNNVKSDTKKKKTTKQALASSFVFERVMWLFNIMLMLKDFSSINKLALYFVPVGFLNIVHSSLDFPEQTQISS